MDDNFLYENRPPVRNGFGENLYTRISSNSSQKKISFSWRLAFQLLILGIVIIASTIAVSSPVRAQVLYWIRQIAGLRVQEMNSLLPSEKEITIPPDVSESFERVRKDLPYEVSLPGYIPDGFIFGDTVDVQGQSIFMHWTNDNQDEILLQVDTDHGQNYLTGKDAAQEIQVNGQPAMLFQGGYDAAHIWDPSIKMINLLQQKGKVVYWLIYIKNSEGTIDGEAAKEELIHMMSSLVLAK